MVPMANEASNADYAVLQLLYVPRASTVPTPAAAVHAMGLTRTVTAKRLGIWFSMKPAPVRVAS